MRFILLIVALVITLHSQCLSYVKQNYDCGLQAGLDSNIYLDINGNVVIASYKKLFDNYNNIDNITTYVPYNTDKIEDYEEINEFLYKSIFYSYKP